MVLLGPFAACALAVANDDPVAQRGVYFLALFDFALSAWEITDFASDWQWSPREFVAHTLNVCHGAFLRIKVCVVVV